MDIHFINLLFLFPNFNTFGAMFFPIGGSGPCWQNLTFLLLSAISLGEKYILRPNRPFMSGDAGFDPD